MHIVYNNNIQCTIYVICIVYNNNIQCNIYVMYIVYNNNTGSNTNTNETKLNPTPYTLHPKP